MIFVFGSNLAGVHVAGAAKTAYQNHGAIHGKGVGFVGNSYAIPTKDKSIVSLQFEEVVNHIQAFIEYAKNNLDKEFKVTQIGCGLAGFTVKQIAPLFLDAPGNCYFDLAWKDYLLSKKFWGTY